MNHVFLDTNVIISGIFFSGLEAEILHSTEIRPITADICKEETLDVSKRKFVGLSSRSQEKVLYEVAKALLDIDIVAEKDYGHRMAEAEKYVHGENDKKVLAAVLHIQPDYFITGDKDFHNEEIKKRVRTVKSREFMEIIGLGNL